MTVSTKAYQASLTPEDVLNRLKAGHQRFLDHASSERDLLEQVAQTAGGQFPVASILSCIDSRAPAEYIFDQGIGDIFNVRIAGNIVNEDILGSLEFSCKVAGSKLILVLGHTDCGAVKGACNQVEMGNLTGLLQKIMPAVQAAPDDIDEVSKLNVLNTVNAITEKSDILKEMAATGDIMIVGAIYDVSNGAVRFL